MRDAIPFTERLTVTLRLIALVLYLAWFQLLSFILYALAGPVQYTEGSNHLQIAQVRWPREY